MHILHVHATSPLVPCTSLVGWAKCKLPTSSLGHSKRSNDDPAGPAKLVEAQRPWRPGGPNIEGNATPLVPSSRIVPRKGGETRRRSWRGVDFTARSRAGAAARRTLAKKTTWAHERRTCATRCLETRGSCARRATLPSRKERRNSLPGLDDCLTPRKLTSEVPGVLSSVLFFFRAGFQGNEPWIPVVHHH